MSLYRAARQRIKVQTKHAPKQAPGCPSDRGIPHRVLGCSVDFRMIIPLLCSYAGNSRDSGRHGAEIGPLGAGPGARGA